jgi:hypothetical protein
MTRPATREALGAVSNGKRWAIPRPENPYLWESETRERLTAIGVRLRESWARDLQNCTRQYDLVRLEAARLYLAAYAKAVSHGPITQEAKKGVCDLLAAVLQALLLQLAEPARGKARPGRAELEAHVDSLKSNLPPELLAYWPDEQLLKRFRAARSPEALEQLRRRLDYTQAVRHAEQSGQKPTAEMLGPRLHKDITAHINDTGEELSGTVFKNPTAEQILKSDVIDQRQPQIGLARRTVQKRYPRKGRTQRDIVAHVYEVQASIPGADSKTETGKTPVRRPVS